MIYLKTFNYMLDNHTDSGDEEKVIFSKLPRDNYLRFDLRTSIAR